MIAKARRRDPRTGRFQSKISKALIEQIVAAMAEGVSHIGAAASVGLCEDTVLAWRRKGRAEVEAEGAKPPWSLYGQYYLRVEIARRAAWAEKEKVLHRASQGLTAGDWRAAAWALRWGQGTERYHQTRCLEQQIQQARLAELKERVERLRLDNEHRRLINETLQQKGPSEETLRLYAQEVLRLQTLDDDRRLVTTHHPIPSWEEDTAAHAGSPHGDPDA